MHQWRNVLRRKLITVRQLTMSHKHTYTCQLVAADEKPNAILLPHQQTVILGRSPLTKIKDTKCSRNQLEFKADCDVPRVTVKQLGANSSCVQNVPLKTGQVRELSAGDVVHFLEGNYPFVLEIDPVPKPSSTPQTDHDLNSDKISASTTLAKLAASDALSGVKRKIEAEVSSPALLPSKILKLEDSPVRINPTGWTDVSQGKLLVYCSPGLQSSAKIAAYDMDGTLITTKSGKVFPTHVDDWKILYSEVPGVLKSLHKDGYKVVIITNQAGIEKGKVKVEEFRRKIETVVKKLGVPIQTFVSTGKAIYRKPAPGIWNFLAEHANEGVVINHSESFFVGDAAGREAHHAPRKKKDHSAADRLFALNLQVKFYTPEEHFLKHKPVPFVLPEFDPKKLKHDLPLLDPPTAKLCLDKQEVIVMVGPPGGGKSHFARKHLVKQGYVYANRDTLKTWQQCVSVVEQALSRGQSAVVDNTNPDQASRARFIGVARQKGVACRCFVMAVSQKHAAHNNRFREFTDESHEPVGDMVLNMYKSKYQEPSLEEGIDEVVRVNFVPQFENPELENLYRMYLVDK